MAPGQQNPAPPMRDRITRGPRNPDRGPPGIQGSPWEFLVPSRVLTYTGGRSAQYRQRQGRFFGKPCRKQESSGAPESPKIIGVRAVAKVDSAEDPESGWSPVDAAFAESTCANAEQDPM